MAQPKIRSIRQTYDFLKDQDPETKISVGMIRKAVMSGDLPSIQSGNRRLILLSDAYMYFYHVPLQED